MFHFDQKNDGFSDLQVGSWGYLSDGFSSLLRPPNKGRNVYKGRRNSHRERTTKETEKVIRAQHHKEENLKKDEALSLVDWNS